MTQYGGFWRRVIAYVIDSILLNIAGSLIGGLFSLGGGLQPALGTSAAAGTGTVLFGAGFNFLIAWLYSALMESSSRQATLGKMAMGMVVTDLHGERIGFGRATARYFSKILSSLILLIGFFMVGWTARKQGLHDMIAGTLVRKARDPRELTTSADVFR